MRILDIQPVADRSSGKLRNIAVFDLELTEEVRIYGLRLLEAADGKRIVYAANANGGRRTATFAPALATAITTAAIHQLEGHVTANGKTQLTA